MKIRIRRHDVVSLLVAAGLVGLLGHYAFTVHLCTDEDPPSDFPLGKEIRQASRGRRIVLPISARPGDVYARSRRSRVLLAGSRQVPSCYVDPAILPDEELGKISEELSRVLDLDPVRVYRELALKKNRRFVWVARGITRQQAEAVENLRCRAVGVQYEWRRDYPNGPLAGTVLGYCRPDGQPGCGLELKAHKLLAAMDGRRVLLGDAWRRPIWSDAQATLRPQHGKSISLTLDVVIQGYLQDAVAAAVREYRAHWGMGVVVNPWTGDILAMCSFPEFDPNQYSTTPPENMLNRAIACPFEPGSVFKPVIAASAVQRRAVSYETKIDCENGTYLADRGGRISDHGSQYGLLSVADILVKSSNIGMAKIGEKLGNRELYRILKQWGFGEKTGIDLPGESSGIVRPLARWDGYSLRRVPFGQEIATTGLQLTMAFSAFANGGLLMKPRIIEHTADAQGQIVDFYEPQSVRRVLSESVAQQTLEVLAEAVRNGTGKKCEMDRWESWGKTGTAQVPGPRGYIENAYVSSFVGGAPLKNPAVVCLISIYRPDRSKGYYGGTVAAPRVKEVLEKTLTYLNVPPDHPSEEEMITAGR